METLKQLLKDSGRNPDKAEELVSKWGFDPATLTDDDAQAIINEELKASAPLATTNGKTSKPAAAPKGKRRKNVPTVREAASHTASLAERELSGFAEALDQGLSAWEEDKADQLVARVRNAPKNVVEKFIQSSLREVDETQTFRESARAFTEDFYPVG